MPATGRFSQERALAKSGYAEKEQDLPALRGMSLCTILLAPDRNGANEIIVEKAWEKTRTKENG